MLFLIHHHEKRRHHNDLLLVLFRHAREFFFCLLRHALGQSSIPRDFEIRLVVRLSADDKDIVILTVYPRWHIKPSSKLWHSTKLLVDLHLNCAVVWQDRIVVPVLLNEQRIIDYLLRKCGKLIVVLLLIFI